MSAAPAPVLTLDVGRSCSNACLFCAQAGDREAPRPMAQQLAEIPPGTRQACFVGGEPTLHDELEAWVRAARDAGLSGVGVQTNGAHMDSPRARALRDAGLTHIELSLHAARADAHDFLTSTPGSFELALGALRAARDAELDVRVVSVLLRSSYRLAPELSAWLAARGVRAQVYVVPLGAGRMRDTIARLMPPLAMSLPHALKAARAGQRAGLWTMISGAPLCMLGPHQELASPSAPRHYPSSCAGCAQRGCCPGVDASYLERFGDEELSAARAPTRSRDHSTEDWRHAFAGVGPLR